MYTNVYAFDELQSEPAATENEKGRASDGVLVDGNQRMRISFEFENELQGC